MTLSFKVWDVTRSKKYFILVKDDDDLYVSLILKASEKMNINGAVLVLESDGTVVDENDLLKHLKDETFIILQPDEIWKPEHLYNSTISNLLQTSNSLPSTITNSGSQPNSDSDVSENASSVTVTDQTWNKFIIPWHKISTLATENFANNVREKRNITEVIHTVVDEVRILKENVPAKALKIISHKIISKYPNIFQDVDEDGIMLGDGSHTVFAKLQDRMNYLNRTYKRNSCSDEETIHVKQKRKMLSVKAGCSNWQPKLSISAGANEQSDLDEAKEKLKETTSFCLSDKETLNLFETSFPEQRKFLNKSNPPSLLEIKREWPLLLQPEGIFFHYKLLMNHEISLLNDGLLSKADKILEFGLQKRYISTTPAEETYKLIEILKIFTTYFKENFNALFLKVQKESDVENVNHTHPYIVCFEGVKEHYGLVMEKTLINQGSTFKHIFQQYFAIFYNLNLVYPSQVASTLEMLQRYIMKIHPDVGSKSKKSKLKVLNLINKLANPKK